MRLEIAEILVMWMIVAILLMSAHFSLVWVTVAALLTSITFPLTTLLNQIAEKRLTDEWEKVAFAGGLAGLVSLVAGLLGILITMLLTAATGEFPSLSTFLSIFLDALPWVLGSSVCGVFFAYLFQYWGQQKKEATVTIVVSELEPIIVAFLALGPFGEIVHLPNLHLRLLIALLLIVSACIIIHFGKIKKSTGEEESEETQSFLGPILIALSAFSFSFDIVFSRKALMIVSPFALTGIKFTIGGFFLLIISRSISVKSTSLHLLKEVLAKAREMNKSFIFTSIRRSVAFIGILKALDWFFYYMTQQVRGSPETATCYAVYVLFTAPLARFILNEKYKRTYYMASGILVVIGVAALELGILDFISSIIR